MFSNLLEWQKRMVICLADALVDDDPLKLVRLVGSERTLQVMGELKAVFEGEPRPAYLSQVYNKLEHHPLFGPMITE